MNQRLFFLVSNASGVRGTDSAAPLSLVAMEFESAVDALMFALALIQYQMDHQ